ncbi:MULTISPECIES: GntR family transcriptional regulator [Rhizobium/Agrobacterium group]|jgi:DNA-binding GntR family transcriptional regulator|nr:MULTISPECIES: GntR family transcriptional regulator [Rhizobium/Agrobacterium group]KQQ75246.1 transcriptional regulator [Rhizobium sp. Leaf321]RYE67737.1 MAG: GntR family transcriptional regulator [Rhizobiaceae bacterium]KQQ35169.1 transcriptional regulator [Rhizobium sp. Leaf306]MBD8664652.1 GntR family transcriptional regulator [Rhizobium sp. CFBP 8752]MBP2459693.1 DNA-binding GntR family transcriptional regulator [Rhizobium sp. PvP014]
MLDGRTPLKKARSDVIADQLEEAVITGEIAAGSRLDENSLAVQFQVSRTPVREALRILCGRGLAEREAFKGVIVTQISTERIDEMFEAMAELEATCGRLSSQRMTMRERAELEAMHREMNGLAQDGDHVGYNAVNTEFHSLLFQGCHNRDLISAAQTLRLKLAPFRKYQLKDVGRLKRSCDEHQQIVDAVLEQDAKAAENALRRHLVSAAQEVLVRRQQQKVKTIQDNDPLDNKEAHDDAG